MNEYIDLLKNISLFENVALKDIPEMLACLKATMKKYQKNSFIKNEGDKADFIGIILEGTVHILHDDYNGKRTITAALGPCDMFAEAFVFADVPFLPVNVLAATDCVILFLDKHHILEHDENPCKFHDKLMENLLKIVSQKNMMLNQKLRYISNKTTSEKLLAFLYDQAKLNHSNEFTIPYNRQALADYLGVERSAMSAEIGKLQMNGLIETHRSYFKLLNIGNLTT